MTKDLQARYRMLKEEGLTPQAAYRAARRDGLGMQEASEAIAAAYGLAETQMRALVEAEDPAARAWLPLDNRERLLATLAEELGHCACAPDDAVSELREFLRAVRDRSDAAGDAAAFARASAAVESRLPLQAAPAFAAWFVYGLQQRGLLWHGFRMTDVWITDRGRSLLDALDRFY